MCSSHATKSHQTVPSRRLYGTVKSSTDCKLMMMERQRSFSFKPTRFLVFSFTISSSLIFLTFFSIWVFKFSPSLHQEANFQFNKPSLSLGPKSISIQSLTVFTTNYSAVGLKNSILIDTPFRTPENSSGFDRVSILKGLPRKENESQVMKNDGNEGGGAVIGNFTTWEQKVSETPIHNLKVSSNERIEEKKIKECDVTNGRWVYDESYPLYTNGSCPFIDEGFNCMGNGRLDRDYMKWRWQPQDCGIPRFNASKMLELIRGKRLVFVGDSINRNQWESMLCLLMGAIKDPKRVYETHGRRITKEKGNYSFKFLDYKCTVEYYVTHFLVHESKAKVGRKRVPTLRIDHIDRGSSRWRGADILVFNTANWWSHYKTKAGNNYYQEGDQVHPRLDVLTAFRKALMTWASWVDKHINPSKTQVFFRSSAPSHFRGGEWNSGGHCREATQPLNKTLTTVYPEKNLIAEDVVMKMKTPVTFLNVTSLSEYRIDGHPSRYGRAPGKRYPSSIQDCSHWCLPGVPDAWNELLYFHVQAKQNNTLTL